jgi:hypothetical protein
VNNSTLQKILAENVVELTFVRRHERRKWNNIRGLLGTTNYELLNGPFGFAVLHFQPPKGVGMGYDYKAKNLCVVWDFFRQEYRVFGAEQVRIRKLFNLTNEDEKKKFYDWFYEYIINMTDQEKNNIMGYEGEAYAALQDARRNAQKVQQKASEPVKHTPSIPQRIKGVYNNIRKYISGFLGKKDS